MPFQRKERLTFTTFKSKLSSVIPSKKHREVFDRDVLLAHEVFRRASSFYRLYCLTQDEIPDPTPSTMKQCINQVSLVRP